MKDPQKLKELILEKIDFTQVLLDYNVNFVYDPRRVDETQLHCPFHGTDIKPSARFYKSTQSLFCWVCRKRWDVIAFIMDKENMFFLQAIRFLIKKYKIDISFIADSPEFVMSKSIPSTIDNYEKFISGNQSNIDLKIIGKKIKSFKRKIPFKKYNALSTAYHMLDYMFFKGNDISSDLIKLKNKIKGIKNGNC